MNRSNIFNPQNIYATNLKLIKPQGVQKPIKSRNIKENRGKSTQEGTSPLQKTKNLVFENPQFKLSIPPTKILFTRSYQKKFLSQREQNKMKRRDIQARSLSKQMSARIERKRRENLQLKDKKELLEYIEQRKIQNKKQIIDKEKKKQEEKQFLHRINMEKISMIRKNHKKNKNKQIQLTQIEERETLFNSKFKMKMIESQKKDLHRLLKTRYNLIFRIRSSDPTLFGRNTGTQSTHRFSRKSSHSRSPKRKSKQLKENPKIINDQSEDQIEEESFEKSTKKPMKYASKSSHERRQKQE